MLLLPSLVGFLNPHRDLICLGFNSVFIFCRYEETENDERRALSMVSRGRTRGSCLPLSEVQGVWRAGPHAERLHGSLVLLLRRSRPPEGCLHDGEEKEGPTFS